MDIQKILDINEGYICEVVGYIDGYEVDRQIISEIKIEKRRFDMELIYKLEGNEETYGVWTDDIEIISDQKLKINNQVYIEWE